MRRILGAAFVTGLMVLPASAEHASLPDESARPLLVAPAAVPTAPRAEAALEDTAAPSGRFAFLPPEEPEPLVAPDVPVPEFPAASPEAPALPIPPPIVGSPVVLYPNVRVKDAHKAHPLALPTVIAVPDPRDQCGLVHIEVCVPPCPYEKFKQNRRGTRTEYDFGKYEVDIITRRGVVTIDYDW